jgi:hypothetical protein
MAVNWGEGLRRVSALIFGAVGVVGTLFFLVLAVIEHFEGGSHTVDALLLAVGFAVLPWPAHKLTVRLASWLVAGFKVA